MNIKDSYLHGGIHVVKDVTFSVPVSGADAGKVVATITWAEEGAAPTQRIIPVSSSVFGSQAKNKVFASPTSENGGAPSFRLLEASDIPYLDANKISSGTLDGDRIPLATTSKRGGFLLGIAQTSDNDAAIKDKKYWIKMNANGKLFVDIPWENNTWVANDKDNAGYVAAPKDGSAYLTNKVWKTDANGNPGWRDDANTWTAASTSAAGYVPKLATGGDTLTTSDAAYILAYRSGRNAVNPGWFLLPANAYLDTWIAYAAPTSSAAGTAGYITPPTYANINKFLKGDGTWQDTYFAIENLTDWASTSSNIEASGVTFPKVWWKIAPTSTNQVYGIGIHPTTGILYYIRSNKGTYEAGSYTANSNTWRAVYAEGNSIATNGTGSWGINFKNGVNTTVVTQARGTGTGLSGSNSYFNVQIDAIDTTYTLKIGTASDALDVVTLLNGTATTTNTIITNSAYNASNNKLATMTDVNNAVGSVFMLKGNASALPTGTQQVGYAYRVSSEFTLAANNSASGSAEILEKGDLIVCTDASTPKYLALNTNWTVTLPNSNTLSTSATTIATIGGIDILATLPSAARGTAGVISLPTGTTTNRFLCENGTWQVLATNISTSLYVGASDGTSTTTQSINGNVYLILQEGNTYTRYNVIGSGRTSVTSDANGKITIDTPLYSNFVKSGTGAAAGLVPSPGTTAGTTKFLCEDGTWKLPSYTTDTVRPIYTEGTSRYDAFTKTGINFTGSGATTVNFAAEGNALYGTITISSANDLVKFSDAVAATTYYLPVKSGTGTEALLLYRSAITVLGTTITASLSGNASTASNINHADLRGYLYLSADAATNGTGVGTTNTTKIAIPYIGYSNSQHLYSLSEDLFYKSSSDIYIGNSIRSTKFSCIKTKNSTTDDWDGSTTSGSLTSEATQYTAGDGILINNGVISSTIKEWFGTEALFDALTSLDLNTTYYITED